MDIKEILGKPIFKKWWFWVIVAVVLLEVIMAVVGEDVETTIEDDTLNSSATFEEDFDSLCDTMTGAYSSVGTVSCQDDTTWADNNELNPESFPYEYRDINAVGDYVAYEIKAIASPENMDYFKEEYTCGAIYGGDGSCIIGDSRDNILYAIILDEGDQEEIVKLFDELKAILTE